MVFLSDASLRAITVLLSGTLLFSPLPAYTSLVVEPLVNVIEVAADAEYECHDESFSPTKWILPNNVTLHCNESYDFRFFNRDGNLQIKNSFLNDSGVYICSCDGSEPVEAVLKVYELRSYAPDISIMLAVNAFLLLLFLTSTIVSHIRQKKLYRLSEKLVSDVGI
uniref:Ig-like domain-containing protein n=2 Tax=Schistocephalus solidus TaxID=70667 RepID=A0A0V0J403_SCHSO